MKIQVNLLTVSALLITLIFSSCKSPVQPKEENLVGEKGFFLLSEGAWGANNASLDFYNCETGEYLQNIFSRINPNIVGGLGDVGNDLQIYGSRLYAVINYSNYVEVMDLKGRHIGEIEVKNCRKIAFCNGKAYITSYGDAIYGDGEHNGFVAEIDTADLKIKRTIEVGYQPDGLAVFGGKIYVANSGGYCQTYANTLSIIDIENFTERKIVSALNCQIVEQDNNGNLFMISNGNYADVNAAIYKVNMQTESIEKIDIFASNFCISDGNLYILSNNTNWETGETVAKKYVVYNIDSKRITSENFITDGTEHEIQLSYGIAVNPVTKEILITDQKRGTSVGEVFCFSPDGVQLWKQTTGIFPKYAAFLK
ncbi:MAG: YncE family protein [Prevotellaceae bacterium]|jgi:DNA-binding beta-propeller fold protein YncE|nr:YncE family protein [Prevotellaceae bacterium]